MSRSGDDGGVGMKRASDIERMLAHIGDPDMRYQEFESARDESRARADWSLLDSATGDRSGRAAGPAPEPAASLPPPPIQRPAYVERELAPAEIPEEPQHPGEARGQLQRVFAKLRGDAAPVATPEPAPARTRDTPLSQLFKRLS